MKQGAQPTRKMSLTFPPQSIDTEGEIYIVTNTNKRMLENVRFNFVDVSVRTRPEIYRRVMRNTNVRIRNVNRCRGDIIMSLTKNVSDHCVAVFHLSHTLPIIFATLNYNTCHLFLPPFEHIS